MFLELIRSKFRVKHEYAKKRIRYFILNTLDNCPDLIKHKLYTHSIEGLSSYMKRHHIETYTMTCEIENCYICNTNDT